MICVLSLLVSYDYTGWLLMMHCFCWAVTFRSTYTYNTYTRYARKSRHYSL